MTAGCSHTPTQDRGLNIREKLPLSRTGGQEDAMATVWIEKSVFSLETVQVSPTHIEVFPNQFSVLSATHRPYSCFLQHC